ncbi:hypothetical protein SUGI_0537550 [Cryptomeria japonica]|nr:hypothetical protein SUGI_0537550 [Cryptomeria japonica]
MLAGISKYLGIASNNVVEFIMLERGLKYCVENRVYPLEIEGDSQIAINAIKNGSTQNWKLGKCLKSILDILKQIPEYHVSHIYGEANTSVDYLANMGVESRYEKEEIINVVQSAKLLWTIRSD